ncbi:uncharacterized protein [Haliotis asinina]|uniref:uncharacterized protein n=1 Tax=Haliotis asinina TaxID=109174 RepID=UPI00353257DB
MIGWVTLDVGEKAIIYSLNGEARIEEGPKRMFLWREKFRELTKYSANQNEYLVVRYLDGCTEHIPGPHVMYRNPVRISSITIQEVISMDANEALVVYAKDKSNDTVKRYIKYGPCQFMPGDSEWLHDFEWHGTDPQNKTHIIRNGQKFKKLKIIPDQFYYNVDEVRTADDALIRVKLMMFYELVDIEKMLNATRDPIADFVNCLCADVVTFASQRTYMAFIEQSSKLNDLDSYPQLLERCKAIGYVVSKVVFRGYFAHDKLQKLHDRAIDKRSQLKLQYEQEEQFQDLTDVKLQNEMQRLDQEQTMELQQLKHQQKMEKDKLIHSLLMEKTKSDDSLAKLLLEKEAQLSAQKAMDDQELNNLLKLSQLKVSLTSYLVASSQQPASITRIMANSPTIHLHHSGAGASLGQDVVPKEPQVPSTTL